MQQRGYDSVMIRRGIALAAVAVAGFGSGVANAGPFCYQTGPGYEKCIDSPSGDYFHPIYQGPRLPDGYVPWSPPSIPAPIYPAPVYPAPVSVPVDTGLLRRQLQSDMQGFFDNPANGKTQYNLHFGRVALTKTGDTTYEGTVAASTGGGPEQDIPVHVTADDSNVAWNLDPGALLVPFPNEMS